MSQRDSDSKVKTCGDYGGRNSKGEPCGKYPLAGRTRCKKHGGAALRGATHPSFKHGRYSKDLPSRMQESYQAAANDPELLNQSAEIALVDARIADVMKRVDTGETGATWKLVKSSFAQLKKSMSEGDHDGVAEALNTLNKAINKGSSDYAAWSEIVNLVERRRKIVESERKRLVEMNQYITAQQGMTLVAALVDSCRRHITDHSQLQAIVNDLTRLTSRPTLEEAS